MPPSRSIWDLGRLPFHVGALPAPEVDGVPAEMPFRLGFDDDLGLFTQMYDDDVAGALRDVYARGSQLGIPMGDEGLGKRYADDFLDVIGSCAGRPLAGASVLEVGCGSGHLLAALAARGAAVFGVEPDPRCAAAMADRGIPVETCELDDFRADGTFDTIVHYCVLEHAPDPVEFLRAQEGLLASGGRIICAVPDCSAPLASGDISMFIHQHWSYFSPSSLAAVANAAGFRVEATRRAGVGGLIYASFARRTDPVGDGGAEDRLGAAVEAPETFVVTARRAVDALRQHVAAAIDGDASLGIYCPARAVNYLPVEIATSGAIRLFDDSPLLTDKYIPPFAAKVEDGAGLARHPVDQILIMSRSFGAAIETAIRARRLRPRPRLFHIDDVLAAG